MPALPVDRNRLDHAYMQVADDIARRIREREITNKLPAERTLAEQYEVSYVTVRHAMALLRECALIISIHGRGTFVAASMSTPQAQTQL
jgi:DNA-binding GntR family transcriptional regulator